MPQIGDIAPDFTLPRDGGGRVRLSALRPGRVVVFFYPSDDTPTCTAEALAFNARLPEFAAAGVTLIGISRDSARSHDRFAAKHGLGMILASDEDGAVCDAWGVWAEKTTFGKTYMGIVRSTFLIDGEGRVEAAWTVLRVKGHVEAVLAAARGDGPP